MRSWTRDLVDQHGGIAYGMRSIWCMLEIIDQYGKNTLQIARMLKLL